MKEETAATDFSMTLDSFDSEFGDATNDLDESEKEQELVTSEALSTNQRSEQITKITTEMSQLAELFQ